MNLTCRIWFDSGSGEGTEQLRGPPEFNLLHEFVFYIAPCLEIAVLNLAGLANCPSRAVQIRFSSLGGRMYDEAELKTILKRAMELDASRAAALSSEQIVQIAAELGISESAVREALREREAARSSQVAAAIPTRRTPALRVLTLSAGVGGLAGLLATGAVSTPLLGMGIVGAALWPALIMVSGGLALTEKAGSLLGFLRRNTALWLGVGAGWSVVSQLFPMQTAGEFGSVRMALIRTVMALVVTTAGGTIYLAFRRSIGATPQGGTPPQATVGTFRRVAARLVTRLRDWILAHRGRTAAAIVPPNVAIWQSDRTHVWALERDEFGLASVLRYRIEGLK